MALRKQLLVLIAAATVVAGLVLGVGGTASAASVRAMPSASADGSYFGCPAGAACLYAQDATQGFSGLDPSRITNVYWTYGAHNLSNEFGWHWIVNNQVPSSSLNAWVETCTGYNGVGCTKQILPMEGIQLDFTPINSIVLDQP